MPPPLVEQLAPGGRLVIPVGPEGRTQVRAGWVLHRSIDQSKNESDHPPPYCLPQVLAVLDKRADGSVARRDVMHVGYVPLTSKAHQLGQEEQ